MYDIIVIGGGPAGLVAALYTLRAGKTVLVIEKGTFGGQITFSPKVENIPGFLSVTGNEFAEQLVSQVMEQGAEFEFCEVLGIRQGDVKTVVTDGGDFEAKAVIIATGARHRTLGLPGEERFIGEGISFCAVCDGAFYEGKTVAVVGGGNSALQEALLLSEQSKKVYVVQNLDCLTGERKLQELVFARENIEVILGSVLTGYLGEDNLSGIRVEKTATREQSDIAVDGVFLAVGLLPQNEPFKDTVRLDGRGYVDADESCLTDANGIFVAGDCRRKRIRQVATAAGDGAVAALAACDYIDGK